MHLHTLSRPAGNKKSHVRIGRGGKRGKTSGRGGKGQTARAGNKRRPELRDIIKKIPKRRGFGKNRGRTVVPVVRTAAVNLDQLERAFPAGATINPTVLIKAGLVRRTSGVMPPIKILSRGDVTKAFVVKGLVMSAAARAKLASAGGTV